MPALCRRLLLAILAMLAVSSSPAIAGGEMRAGGKLLLTGGVTGIEGAAGGGLATWALIAGNETRDGIGGSTHLTYVPLSDFDVTSFGAAVGIKDRLELSYTRSSFDTRALGAALGLGHGFTFNEDVFGAKLRVLGDAVYDQDSWLPQVAIGAQLKHANRGALVRAIGAKDDTGVDFYLAATKLLLARSLVVNATLRMTRANQLGLLGFGGDREANYTVQFEGSAGTLLTRRLLVGAEYRTKPDNLGFAKEEDAFDVFAAYQLTRNVAVTAAYADLGSIATKPKQRGAFLSLQASF